MLRAELFSLEQLKRHGVALAEQHPLSSRPGPDRLLPRLAENSRRLLAAYDVVTTAASPGQRVVPAEAWLLDNFYLIEQQISEVRRHLPRGYSRQLPQLADGPSAGFPRIYDLALELISHMDGRVDHDNATQFIAAYQSVEPLKVGELWAFPIMLKLALLENLRRVGVSIAQRRRERDAALAWADRMLVTAEQEPKQLIQLLAEFARSDVPLTAPFVEAFDAALQAQGPALAFIQTWVEHKLLEQGVTASQLAEVAGRTAAANQISMANSIGSLRFIGSMDWKDYVESLSVIERILRDDPVGMHAAQDFATRDRYRHVVEDVAREAVCPEPDVARAAIELARAAAAQHGEEDRSAHVGYYLIDRGRPALEQAVGCRVPWISRIGRRCRPACLPLYLGVVMWLTLLGAGGVLLLLDGFTLNTGWAWLLALPLLIAVSSPAVSLVNMGVTLLLTPKALPRMDFSGGIPKARRTMVIVPTLLTGPKDIDHLLEALEIRYLGNRDPNLFFALLTDFPDAPQEVQPQDAALLEQARTAVERLNLRYREDRPGIFYLFHRPRVWNPFERVWMGYERKRGKLEQFNARLRGEGSGAFSEIIGDTGRLTSIRFVITLDTDTQLPRDAARQLVGNLAHPLNRPVLDPERGRIVEGHGILQPRTSISLNSALQSRFSRLFAGEPGMDPYTREVSDVYQDLFGEGSFVGKGIYDVDAFRHAIDGRLPENLILSHDLLEGGYARSALVTDVDLLETLPATYPAEASRRHRWIRGDWQLMGWLLPRVPAPRGRTPARVPNPLSALSRWKLFDNLRRSLVAPSLLALLLGGWLLGVGPVWLWSLLVLALVVVPALLPAMIDLGRRPQDRDRRVHLSLTGRAALRPLAQAMLTLAFLPYDVRISLGAIVCSWGRMLFTRRGLLLWQLPSYARRNACRTPIDFLREMWLAPILALSTGAALVWTSGDAWATQGVFAAPFLLMWLVSPGIGWWISRPPGDRIPRLNVSQEAFLRRAARRTWRYFADFVGPEDHWLPPDNVQEYPRHMVASRTSPTNIGMSLLSELAAHDFGYVTIGECLSRIDRTVSSMERLERYRGHFYNWYDTRTLKPLQPRYVSSVDSGNLAGALLTLQAGLDELKHQPVPSSRALQGLLDTLGVLAEHRSESSPPLVELERRVQGLQDAVSTTDLIKGLEDIQQAGGAAAAWLAAEGRPAGDEASAYWVQAFDGQLAALRDELVQLLPAGGSVATEGPSRAQLDIIDDLIRRCRHLATMDFEFLYDAPSGLLAIGYDVGERRRDPACYDLLASEARLASFLLIAQGQLPQKHWFALGRLLTSQGRDVSLISWSGSMFEYLMPQLIMPSFGNTLLAQTCKAAVSRQIEYGRQRAVPWGISESCYNVTDMSQVYQYRAFGVPGLGFKRGLGEDLVIAPYATALALTVLPEEACRNLERMASTGFLGEYGFYEAVDYTPSRVPRGKSWFIVRSFMAHHQGMSLLALAHALLDQPMQRRFMADPQVRATELLLQERVPRQGGTLHPHAAEVSASAQPPDAELGSIMRVFRETTTQLPEVHLLSNGRYHVMATHAGGGYSRRHGLAVTRWREDVTTDAWGTFIYLRDRDSGEYWSSAHQPTLRRADHYEAIFVQARAEYRRQDQAIDSHTEICVSPEDDVEIRRVTLTNQSSRTRHIELTSYAEVVLAPLAADLAHRAFSNLFVQTEILPDHQAILCTRRRRTPDEQVPWMFHLMAAPGAQVDAPSFETDRARFVGRGRTPVNPVVMDARTRAGRLSDTAGAVLDPIVAIRRTVTLAPDESASVQIISGVADTREAALGLLEKYCDRHFVERAFEMAWFQSQEVLRVLNATEVDAQVYGRLANSVVFGNALRRAAPGVIARNQLGQSGLWRFAISGDLPIVLLHVGDIHRIDRVKQVLQAHAYWRMKGLSADLVILNEDFSGYRAVLHDRIMGLINSGPEAQMLDKPGGVFLRRAEELSEDERVLLQTVARIVFSDTADTLIEPVERRISASRPSDRLEPVRPVVTETPAPPVARELIFDNGLGGFTPDGREYVITLAPGQATPAPWANVIASPHIGTVVSEAGSAYTWVDNAHEFRLTHWHNDPLSDASGEAFYIRDEETGAFWSPTPLPARGRNGYVCRHGFGYSIFEYQESGIASESSIYVAMDAPVKCVVIKLHNHSRRARRLSLTGYWELVLGEWRHANLMHIVTETEPHTGALLARNAYGQECAHRLVFAHVSGRDRSISGGRTEFIGRNGSMANPAAMRRKRLSNRTGGGMDPCAAVQGRIELEAGQSTEVVFVFGAATTVAEVEQYIHRFGGRAGARQALEQVWEYWNHTLGAVQVDTPDPALNVLANGWLVYQTLSSRLWARSGYYQSGGAYGFRDQLQDAMALVHATPELAREQLIRCAGRQFLKGDVQHWWHPPGGQGVRTHFSDDYLWLPYVACHYVTTTGDTGVLDEPVHFLEGRELNPDEEAHYSQPQRSQEVASLYEHCVRALRHGLRFGAHQLPLMGCGDWNDGMNRVGHEGRGESVWLAWFLLDALQRFADLARSREDGVFAELCQAQARQLRRHIEASAWDGAWYRRAWFDDGTPLGSSENDECRIDAISQSWSVLSGAGDPQRAREAMNAVYRHLVSRDDGLIRLLDPPFDQSELEPGYIKGYVPGVRENGGQYTHAAIWTTMAFARMGDRKRAWECYALLNPVHHGDTPEAVARYKVEPYVMSADVYGSPPHTGRGGWTWYTGAAGWMYRLTVETLLGLQREVDHLRIAPCIPDHWDAYTLHYRYRETLYHIHVSGVAGGSRRVTRVTLDGTEIRDEAALEAGWGRIPLVDDRQTHHVEVGLG
ncbi:GH36-type glycosyl hydrolase domain-containing protein [Ectothiorhodospira sp. BSL-9]|uniref:GH36-type glycosyl hydrolase domain-containing protein n=1 Tax=Ectothiorhodospira sp. BSL-9 TaxID=1442136 RepID=UPI0007B44C6A|nr:glucoamylase family protein [Ectothiorhodospira sp. BSL-9]ANB03777.1 NdvB [Ectothiorhodospira sp. BSL-9]